MLGDANKHIGDLVEGNHDKVTAGGRFIREFLTNGEYVLVNGTNKSHNGPFTRVDPADPNNDARKSCLDLVIMSKSLFKYVDTMTIDKDRILAPNSINKKRLITTRARAV